MQQTDESLKPLLIRRDQIHRVEKPWGYELIWAKTESYVGKVLHIRKGFQLSLQYHQEKVETVYVQSGLMKFLFESAEGVLEELTLSPGDSHHIPQKRKHRMIALEDCDVFEVSTPQLHDVVRLEDQYGRIPTPS